MVLIGLVRWTPVVIQAFAACWVNTASMRSPRDSVDPQVGYRIVIGRPLGSFAFGLVQVVGPSPIPPTVSRAGHGFVEIRLPRRL